MELGSAALFAVQMWRCEKLIRQVPENEVLRAGRRGGVSVGIRGLVVGFVEATQHKKALVEDKRPTSLTFPFWALIRSLQVASDLFQEMLAADNH